MSTLRKGTRLERGRRAALLAALILSLATSLPAQNKPCTKLKVPVNVVNERGEPIQDLSGGTWTAKFRRKPVKILLDTWEAQPRRIVLVLDASGSMVGGKEPMPEWDVALHALVGFLRWAPAENQFALLVFSHRIDAKAGFEQNRDALAQHLFPLVEGSKALPKGSRSTALYDALAASLELLGTPQPGDLVFVVTDGWDNQSRKGWREVQRAFLAAQARLFAMVVTSDSVYWPPPYLRFDEEGLPENLREIVQGTGGNWLQVKAPLSEAQLYVMLQRMYAEMAGLHWLEIELPTPLDKTRSWTLKWEPLEKSAQKGIVVLYPQKLASCAGASR